MLRTCNVKHVSCFKNVNKITKNNVLPFCFATDRVIFNLRNAHHSSFLITHNFFSL